MCVCTVGAPFVVMTHNAPRARTDCAGNTCAPLSYLPPPKVTAQMDGTGAAEAAGSNLGGDRSKRRTKKRLRGDDELPPWGAWMQGIDLDDPAIPFKRVRRMAKRARVGAGGGRAACVARLRDFLALESPPQWWAEAQAKAALCLTLEDDDEGRVIQMHVGQRLEIPGSSTKLKECSASLVSAEPKGCVVVTRKERAQRGGWRGGPGGHKVIFLGQAPGNAVVRRTSKQTYRSKEPKFFGEPILLTIAAAAAETQCDSKVSD